MAFPLLSAGVLNAALFGSYAKALDYLTQAQCSGDSQSKPASSAQVFAAGCLSGLAQVRTSEVCLIDWLFYFGHNSAQQLYMDERQQTIIDRKGMGWNRSLWCSPYQLSLTKEKTKKRKVYHLLSCSTFGLQGGVRNWPSENEKPPQSESEPVIFYYIQCLCSPKTPRQIRSHFQALYKQGWLGLDM